VPADTNPAVSSVSKPREAENWERPDSAQSYSASIGSNPLRASRLLKFFGPAKNSASAVEPGVFW
jgi:hypothetical protein